jgi:cellulose synthase operon protein YhjQ
MTDVSLDPDQSQSATAEDIVKLYAEADVHGTRYRDFSASRKEARGQFRRRLIREQAERAEAKQRLPLAQRTGDDVRSEALDRPPRGEPILSAEASAAIALHHPPKESVTPGPRWYALQSVSPALSGVSAAPLTPLTNVEQRPSLFAVFSLAGGVGKTCLIATLGRALSALGERVLLADTSTYGLLHFYFGSREFKPGVLRTFSPHETDGNAPVQVLNLTQDPHAIGVAERDPLLQELVLRGRDTNRILLDVATADQETTRWLFSLRPTILLPILPDVTSVASLGLLEKFFAGAVDPDVSSPAPFYVLNQFDAALALHVDVRETLKQRLGERLLPFVLRRSPSVSEALAEGMTVIDYAPGSEAAEDYWKLAAWLRSLAVPASIAHREARWLER